MINELHSIDPVDNQLVKVYEKMADEQAAAVVASTHAAWLEWRHAPLPQRAECLHKAADVLAERKDEFADLITKEMGKVRKEGIAEVDKCAWVCRYYADNGAAFLDHEPVVSDAAKSYVAFRPLGVVLAVMPWNFPFWQVLRFAAPALMAGNAGVLKHASNVTGCALAIESVFRQAGFPEHLFRTLLVGTGQVGDIIAHPAIKAVTLTGSTPAGKAVAAKAGEMLKKSVLELGGSDPYLILEDADLDRAVDACANSRMVNAGQSCIAAKRFVVVDAVREAFQNRLVAALAKRKMGPPKEPPTDYGPMARVDLRDALHQQVADSIKKGATCLLGGEIPPGDGAFYPATVLTDVKPGMPAYHEELFGPVAAIIPVANEEAAIRVANDSEFGLGAAVFTNSVERGEDIAANQLDAGCCFVNDFVRSDPRLPFGGIKTSGYGRELGPFGIREFVNVKTVYVA